MEAVILRPAAFSSEATVRSPLDEILVDLDFELLTLQVTPEALTLLPVTVALNPYLLPVYTVFKPLLFGLTLIDFTVTRSLFSSLMV